VSRAPEANDEYSRGSGASRRPSSPRGPGGSGGSRGASWLPSGTAHGWILAGALLGALLLLVAEFTALYDVHAATSIRLPSVGTGSNDSYALVPLALLAALLGIAVFVAESRPALLAIGVIGLVALLIALLGDLPDAHRTTIYSPRFVLARSTPSAGFYLETLGAVVLLATCVLGFLGLGRPVPRRPDGGTQPSPRGSGRARGDRSPSTRARS
jgi:hypothetical protein